MEFSSEDTTLPFTSIMTFSRSDIIRLIYSWLLRISSTLNSLFMARISRVSTWLQICTILESFMAKSRTVMGDFISFRVPNLDL